MQHCPQCGSGNKDGAPICAGCGHALPTAEKASSKETASPLASHLPRAPSKLSFLAILSFILGFGSLAIYAVGFVFAIPGVICGHMALKRIKSSGGALRGRGLATGGLVTGYLEILLGLYGLINSI